MRQREIYISIPELLQSPEANFATQFLNDLNLESSHKTTILLAGKNQRPNLYLPVEKELILPSLRPTTVIYNKEKYPLLPIWERFKSVAAVTKVYSVVQLSEQKELFTIVAKTIDYFSKINDVPTPHNLVLAQNAYVLNKIEAGGWHERHLFDKAKYCKGLHLSTRGRIRKDALSRFRFEWSFTTGIHEWIHHYLAYQSEQGLFDLSDFMPTATKDYSHTENFDKIARKIGVESYMPPEEKLFISIMGEHSPEWKRQNQRFGCSNPWNPTLSDLIPPTN